MKKAVLLMGIAAMLLGTENNVPDDYRPRDRKPISKPATLSRKEWKKRKAKIKASKQSRKANR